MKLVEKLRLGYYRADNGKVEIAYDDVYKYAMENGVTIEVAEEILQRYFGDSIKVCIGGPNETKK